MILVAVPDNGFHDMPPRWDGHAVLWRGWRPLGVHICPPRPECCESCGSLASPLINLGLVANDQVMTHDDVTHDDQAVDLARRMGQRRERHAWLRLTAFRCPDCHADSVLDADGVLWELDQSDYGDAGSVPPPEQGRLW